MLYMLLYSLHEYVHVLNVVRYLTFRTALSTLTALASGRKAMDVDVIRAVKDDW